jgi:hypothetical protein
MIRHEKNIEICAEKKATRNNDKQICTTYFNCMAHQLVKANTNNFKDQHVVITNHKSRKHGGY